jgi:hypothetical protein
MSLNTNIGTLSWQNDNGLNNYPLMSDSIKIPNVIVDANFLTLDGFIPVLKTMKMSPNTFIITLSVFSGVITVETEYPLANNTLNVSDGVIKHGVIVFGDGLQQLRNKYKFSLINVNTAFSPMVVTSLNSKLGVFSIDNMFGDVHITADVKNHVQFTEQAGEVHFDAISFPDCNGLTPLLSLNGTHANSVNIKTSDVLNVSAEPGKVTISLAAGALIKNNIKPTT